ncbi:MAG: hypothetical protein ACLP6G_10280 [Terriglobales bacterium]
MFHRWQKEFFENGAAAFQSQERLHRQVEEKQKRIEYLEKKVQTKGEVLAELMAEHVALALVTKARAKNAAAKVSCVQSRTRSACMLINYQVAIVLTLKSESAHHQLC